MVKSYFICLSFLMIFNLAPIAAQDFKISTLETVGIGEMKVAPDWSVLNIDLTSKNMNFNQAIQDLNKKAAQLEKEFVQTGFSKSDLKTSGYAVNKNIVYSSGAAIDSGYLARQTFTVEFPYEQQKIIKVVNWLSESKAGLTFNFTFSLSDKKRKETENGLLKKAIADADSKAKVLSEAAGATVKRIIEIRYGIVNFEPRPYTSLMEREAQMTASTSAFSGFSVLDLNYKDEVRVSYEMEVQK